LVSVLQDGNLIYRAYADPAVPLSIDLARAAPALPRDFQPVALAAMPDGSIVAAGNNRTLYRFRDGAYRGSVNTGALLEDVAPGGKRNPGLFGCDSSSAASLVRYDPDSLRKGPSWFVGSPAGSCVGLASDAFTGTLYIGLRARSEIYHLLPGAKVPSPFANLAPSLNRLDALAVDAVRKRLFIADPSSATIYVMGLDRRGFRGFAQGLGTIKALAVDATRQRLYAASESRVWQFDLADASPAARDFIPPGKLGSATAICVDAAGTVWVGDSKLRTLQVFTPEGQLKATLGAK